MPVATPTLAIADLGTGLGATATITGGEAGATNTVSTLAVTGDIAAGSWVSKGSRVGPGTLSLSLTNGYYWGKCDSVSGTEAVVSNLVYFVSTLSTDSVQKRAMYGIQARIRNLVMTDFDADNVKVGMTADPAAEHFPIIFLSLEEEIETLPGGTNERDDVGFPVRVTIADRHDPSITDMPEVYAKWRQQIHRAFDQQRLPGVTDVHLCTVTPRQIIDPRLPAFQYFTSGLTIRCFSRMARGLTT